MPSINVASITVAYSGDIVIDNMSFEYLGTGLIQILGPNGAGKTTLMKTILGLIKPLSGRVFINGVDVTGKPEKAGVYTGYVPQLLSLSEAFTFPLTAWEIVENSLLLHKKKWPRRPVYNDKKLVADALKKTGIPREFWFKSFWKLSGGLRQRVLIARALVHDPDILVMDEPLSSVDPSGRVEIASLIGELAREKLVLVTSHDPMLLLKYTNLVILMNRGIYITGKPSEVLTVENTQKIYGEAAFAVKDHIHICDTHV